MRRLIPLLLPLVGVLYPFVLYFGMGKVSPPVFALVLGAVWLIRAPSLLREPGGRWMIGVALVYCATLSFTGEPLMLQWYPVLMNALLMVVFGITLIHGPPFIERVARLREPDLPPAAVRYTRVVTKVWTVFFALSGATSAALTLWGSLAWWTLYNGLISYLLVGFLFSVEWLLRQRLRRSFA